MAHAGELPEYVSDDDDETSTPAVVGGGHARVGGASATFADFCLKPQITKAITAAGFEQPSKIQEEAIPEAHAGNDIIAQAKSGMGKTAVFVLVTLDRYDPSENPGHVYCVVVEPTKELVQQVVLEYKRFSPFMDGGISVMSITGGESIKEQSEKLKSSPPAIIVATPGRLSDLVDKGAIDLSKIKFFVIDEVDKVLEKAGPFPVSCPADLYKSHPYPKFRFQTCVRTSSKSSSRPRRTSRPSAFPPLWRPTC
jgi:ATP-dependent RNA helicase UAP56/SUB2